MQGLEPGGVAVLNADIAEAHVLRDVAADRMGATARWFGDQRRRTTPCIPPGSVRVTGDRCPRRLPIPVRSCG